MRFIKRLPKPDILEKKEKIWTDAFTKSEKKRPDTNKYAHKQIKRDLNTMSFHKCFYCERKLKDIPGEVDHYIEVAERRDLAFDWSNLYLACDNCNNKLPNKTIPVDQVLDPCKHSDDVIQEHVTFEDEVITAKNNSPIGLETIKKYRLDSEQIDNVRRKQIILFFKALSKIQYNRLNENREMNSNEIEALLRFKQPDQSFSLMFKILLDKYVDYL